MAVSDAEQNWDGGTLKVEGLGNLEGVTSTGTLGFGANVHLSVAAGVLYYDAIALGTVTGGSGGADLLITFNGAVTNAYVQIVLRSLQYSSSDVSQPVHRP